MTLQEPHEIPYILINMLIKGLPVLLLDGDPIVTPQVFAKKDPSTVLDVKSLN